VLRLYSLASQLNTVGMRQGDFTIEAHMENWLVAVDLCREVPRKLMLHSRVKW